MKKSKVTESRYGFAKKIPPALPLKRSNRIAIPQSRKMVKTAYFTISGVVSNLDVANLSKFCRENKSLVVFSKEFLTGNYISVEGVVAFDRRKTVFEAASLLENFLVYECRDFHEELDRVTSETFVEAINHHPLAQLRTNMFIHEYF